MESHFVPRQMFFTKGVGKHRENLQSFEEALRDAGIASFNLVRVSSIYPPQCRIVSRRRGLEQLNPGEIIFCVLADSRTNEPNRLVGAGIGLAVPADQNKHGYIAEHHGFGMTQRICADYVEDMAATMLARTQGIDLDPDTAYNERKDIYRAKGLVVKTRAAVQTAEGDKNGLWTTALAAAVFIL
ncbi:MAG: arginine decarboxylase, pyruvoyl-dependent [Phycisphaerales bacterium]|nr:MAG: arginine decarboxylase, pyruvoyl-dependent [Phycisphaerales bacterium]